MIFLKRDLFLAFAFGLFQNAILVSKGSPLEYAKISQNRSFWGPNQGSLGAIWPKQLEIPVSLSLGIYGTLRSPHGPYIGSGPLKTGYLGVS